MSFFRSLCMKAQCLRELRIRYGFGSTISGIVFDPFEFRSQTEADWRNIEQLEAVVEFFVNYRPDPLPAGRDDWGDPWAANAKPLDDSHAQYKRVNLGLIEGTSAVVRQAPQGNVIELDGEPDLRDVVVNPRSANNPAQAGGPVPLPTYPVRRRYLYDTIYLEEATGRTSKLFRIIEVDNGAKTVTVDPDDILPNFGEKKSSRWTLNRRPIIVLIDPLGARTITSPNAPNATTVWSGANATVFGPDPANPDTRTVLQLDGGQALDRINTGQDTIYLPNDSSSHKPPRAYRVVNVNAANRQITVDGTPNIGAGSLWHIPAGLSGTLSGGPAAPAGQRFQYNLDPPNNPAPRGSRGYDHYDADLFIVHRGKVESRFRFTSFSSRDYGSWRVDVLPDDWRQFLSSARGNGRYYYHSFRSGNQYINYSLAIIDATLTQNGLQRDLNDRLSRARFYFGTASPPATAADGAAGDVLSGRVMDDSGAANPLGKVHVRFHRGNFGGSNSGSAGCMVSPNYFRMRNALVEIYEKEYREFYGGGLAVVDPHLHRFIDPAANPNGLSIAGSAAILNANSVTADEFNHKLAGSLWLIRPDEPPLT